MKYWILLLIAASAHGQDLSARVRREVLSQINPIVVNVSTQGRTMIEFPAPVEAIDGAACTQHPEKEAADFWIVPGKKWVSVQALHADARQNLSVVIEGKVYEVWIQTNPDYDFSVLFRFVQVNRSADTQQPSGIVQQ